MRGILGAEAKPLVAIKTVIRTTTRKDQHSFRKAEIRQWSTDACNVFNSAVPSSDNPAILQVIPALNAGGAERTTVDIARALLQNGFRAVVGSQGGRMEPLITGIGGEIYHLPLDSKAPHELLRNAFRLESLIRRNRIQLVHARSRAPAWSALLAARRTRIPFVTTYHGVYNARTPLKRFYNSAMVRSDAIIANSNWTAEHIVREHGITPERIAVVHRGVDLAEFCPEHVLPDRVKAIRSQWQLGEQSIILLPGRLTRWKGQLVLIHALSMLAKEAKLSNVKAILLGDAQGRDGYVRELREAISRGSLGGIVQIEDHVGDMPAAYLASEVVVSASTDPEAFGRVSAEASAMERPVIATDHGGARETILCNRSGLLTPPADAEALSRAIDTLLSQSRQFRKQMGIIGRGHIAAHFSLERMCSDTLTIYRRLLSTANQTC